jgi:hypothetical protein
LTPTPAEQRILREARRREKRRAFKSLRKHTHPKAYRAIAGKRRRKAICAGRRGAKTRGVVALAALWSACFLGWRNLYVTLTRSNARDLIWDDLVQLNRDFALGGDVQLGRLRIVFPGGGMIVLAGANNEREIQKIRGKFWHRVYVDECQSIPDRVLIPLLGPVLAATLLDHGGELWLLGSRPAVRQGRWFEVTEGKLAGNFEQHRFDVRDNTYLPQRKAGRTVKAILADFRRDEGWTEADITYRREVLNEDIPDLEALLFSFDEQRNVTTAIPVCEHFVFGVDQGADDSDAIAVLGWRDDDPHLYLVEEFVRAKVIGKSADVTDLWDELQPRIEKYAPRRIVIDQGGGGKKSANEIRNRHHIALEAAEKSDKPGFIKEMNRDLRKGLIRCPPGSRFEEDCRLVRKDPAALMRDVLQELPRAKGGYHSDICDAVLYAWRASRNYLHEPPVKQEPPKPIENELEAKRRAKLEENAERPRKWWEDGRRGPRRAQPLRRAA